MKFTVNFLPAKYGDCIWVEYGDEGNLKRILIDGGTAGTRTILRNKIEALPENRRHFDLIVVTHIDRDHIEGILRLLEEDHLGFTASDFWFNGWNHLPGNNDDEFFGPVQGERLTKKILDHHLTWNAAFNGKAVVIPADGTPPVCNLPGGMKLTLLSPVLSGLTRLRPKWEAEVLEAGLQPGFGDQPEEEQEQEQDIERFGVVPNIDQLNEVRFKEDRAEANGSSIAFLAEFNGKSVLFAGDAHPGIVLESLNKLYDDKAPVTLMKMSHHASSHNTSPELIEKLECNKYVISTNGSIYHHPNQETIAWVIKRGGNRPELIFNYTSPENEIWEDDSMQALHNFKTTYPRNEGIEIDLL